MKRKLIKQGRAGHTIYLPKKWVEKKGLNNGDEIDLIETDTGLVVGSHIKENKEITIELNETNRTDLRTILTHVYRVGYNKITITNIGEKEYKKIKKVTNELLLGFEITDKQVDKCSIENLSEPREQKYEVLLRRIFLIIKETQDLVIKDFERNEFFNLKEVEGLRKQQDKFILFCKRVLIKEKYERNIIINWELLKYLMHIEHAHHYMYKYAADNKISQVDSNIIKLLKDLKDYFNQYYTAYFKRDLEIAHKINNMKKKYHFGECLDFIEKSSGKNAVIFSYIRELFRWIQIGTSPLLSEIFERDYK